MMAGSTVAVASAALTGARRRSPSSCSRSAGRCSRCSRPARPRSTRRWPGRAAGRWRSTPSSTGSGSRCTAPATRSIVATRSLDVITDRLPEVVAVARALPADGSCSTARCSPSTTPAGRGRSRRPRPAPPWREGRPAHALLLRRAPPRRRRPRRLPRPRTAGRARRGWCRRSTGSPRLVTADPAAAEAFVADVLAARPRGRRRQEPRRALRRRPPRRRLGQGQAGPHPRPRRARRRVGLRPAQGLALQHPPRRARPGDGGFVMLGKTFKGMTDEMLAWQTERFTELATAPADGSALRRARPARAGRRDRLRRPPALHPLPRRPGAAVRPGRPLPRRQVRRRGRHDRDGAGIAGA